MSNTKMRWEAKPQDVRKIVMELVSELDPSLLSSPAVEKCIHDITSYANEVADERVREFVTWQYGERCETKDTDDFPELKHDERCPTCEAWERYDEFNQLRRGE